MSNKLTDDQSNIDLVGMYVHRKLNDNFLITTDDNKLINTNIDVFYSVDKNLNIHLRLWCKTCKHFAELKNAEEYIKQMKEEQAAIT